VVASPGDITAMIRRILLSLCVVLVVAAPAYANDGLKHGLRGMQGTVASIADDSITVRRGDDELTCVRGKHSPAIDGIEVGDHVAVLCRQRRHHRRVLVRVKKLEDAAPKGDEGQRVAIAGKITVLGDSAITVHNDESGRTLTCRIPDRHAEPAQKLEVGDRIAMLCRGPQDGTPELVKLIRPEQKGGGKHDGDKPGLTDIAGHVTALGDGSITVGNGDGGRTLTCTVPDALAASVAALQVGAAAKMICRNGELIAIKGDAPSNPSAPRPEPHSFSFTGPVTLLSGDRVGVRVEGATRSCFVPADLRPQLSGFALEQPAALTCQGADAAHATLTAIAHTGA
jgi:hypothetical protein